ncbi:hypothetical protein A5699_18275 [Mycobacterium sp. E802]|uniref:hypothetical protein n=1 Tax=Mycobacterium sp. E802 TaxID=1834152 RepID=UPI00080067F5|nr:hypothetical protein [Mycobacterium sp. E802]OBG87966.1 hypothetical protein A5699_18275 [Mycobacterium sp. E802]
MTTPSSAYGGGWRHQPHAMTTLDHRLSRRQARQMSRRFAGVGVAIDAARLRQISSGAPAANAELTNVEFAVVACELMQDQHLSRLTRGKQHCLEWLVVLIMGLIMFGALVCATVLMLSLMSHSTPF